MAVTISCCAGPLETLGGVLLAFIELGTDVPTNLYPAYNDSETDLYRKILLVMNYI